MQIYTFLWYHGEALSFKGFNNPFSSVGNQVAMKFSIISMSECALDMVEIHKKRRIKK